MKLRLQEDNGKTLHDKHVLICGGPGCHSSDAEGNQKKHSKEKIREKGLE